MMPSSQFLQILGETVTGDVKPPFDDFNPYAASYPVNITRIQRSQIRALWWWRNYLYNLRVEYRCKFARRPLTPDERRAITAFAIKRARTGELPSWGNLTFEYRQHVLAAMQS